MASEMRLVCAAEEEDKPLAQRKPVAMVDAQGGVVIFLRVLDLFISEKVLLCFSIFETESPRRELCF